MSSIEPSKNNYHVNLHAMTTTEARDRLDQYQKAHGFTNRGDALNHLLLSMLPESYTQHKESSK